jgi:hypothetical protein
MEDLKKRMDVVHAIGRTPVLLSVFLMFIRACTSRLSSEERDETVDVQTCPSMPSSLHYLYQEALWGALEARESSSSALLEVLERVAFENMKHGPTNLNLKNIVSWFHFENNCLLQCLQQITVESFQSVMLMSANS